MAGDVLAGTRNQGYCDATIRIRFPNAESMQSALSSLAGRFSFKSWATGEMLVPEDALPFLAVQGVAFAVEGPATPQSSLP